ncbi:MAG: hypothetical protein JST00_24360 [Deltaproteobacteria bacterium]|nr:hypothetical protein [Deltaproteobacteria bacterium]
MSNAKKPTRTAPRKLLVAALGVATVNYVVACGKNVTSGNLPAPDPRPDPSTIPVAGNLPAPPPPDAASPTPTAPPPSSIPPTSGNLPAPPPRDAVPPKPKK